MPPDTNQMTDLMKSQRLIIISNRLPIAISKEEGDLVSSRGSGGLVTAIAPVIKNRGGVWVGWPGKVDKEDEENARKLLQKENSNTGFLLHPVFLSEQEVKFYYEGFANELIWPLFHDLQSDCRFNPLFWKTNLEVNERFAKETFAIAGKNDFLWVHDYQLLLMAQYLRKLGAIQKTAFFLHIPFPSLDIFLKLPWRFQVLRALLEYDLIGFQTLRDQRNFIQCVKRLLPDIQMKYQRNVHTCITQTRSVLVSAFPISIDYNEFAVSAARKDVTEQAGFNLEQFKGQQVVFSCDRLDITKGIPYRLEAIRYLLKTHPELHGKVTFFQIVIPSRTEILQYQELKKEIDRLVGEINSQFTETGWVPVQYIYRSITRKELLAYYRISNIALITPVKDGMNLVCKEYIASNVNQNGVLILSEFAGAAIQFQHEAILINPYDIEGLAEAIYQALNMPPKECKKRMKKMRRNVQRYDVYRWVKNFLEVAISKELHDFPLIQEYTPQEEAKSI